MRLFELNKIRIFFGEQTSSGSMTYFLWVLMKIPDSFNRIFNVFVTYHLLRNIKRPTLIKKAIYIKKISLAFRLRARVLPSLHKTGFKYCPPSHPTILPPSPPAPLTILPKIGKKIPLPLTTDLFSHDPCPLKSGQTTFSLQLFPNVPCP